jgi:hypothetical protein
MLTLVILLATSVTCIVLGYIYDNGFVGFIGFCAISCLIILLLSLININSRFQVEIEEYNNLKAQIEAYNALPDSCKDVSFEFDLRRDVIAMNNKISKHKVMSKSGWSNLWNSEEIGSLEKLHVYGKKE